MITLKRALGRWDLTALGVNQVIGGAMGFRDGVETMSIDGKRRREYLPGLNDAQRRQVVYFAIYPNLLLSLHPDYVMTHTLWPRERGVRSLSGLVA